MPSTYKTPGVYIEEITKFPPSVAEVETAIPAFIGYTEFALQNGESLLKTPTRISSFLEFEQYFGGPPPRDIIIWLNSANQYVRTEQETNAYLLYDSLRLFYDNGGGACYIVSVGDYTTAPAIGDINTGTGILGGLKMLEKYDEPTLLLSPDVATLEGSGELYSFQVQALAQCNLLMDRFLIGDLYKSDEKTAGKTHADRVADFRNNIGINYLKYGAAYTPWLRTTLTVDLFFRDVLFGMDGGPVPTADSSLALLMSLTSTPSLQQLMYDLSNAIKTVDTLSTAILPGGTLVDGDVADLDGELKKLLRAYRTVYNTGPGTYAGFSPSLPDIYARIVAILAAVWDLTLTLPAVVTSLPAPSPTQTVEFKLINDINNLQAQVKSIMSVLVTHQNEINNKSASAITLVTAGGNVDKAVKLGGWAALANVPKDDATQYPYRTLTMKIALWTYLKGVATTAAAVVGAKASDVQAAVAAVIPAPGDVKTIGDADIATARAAAAATAADVVNAIAGAIPGEADVKKKTILAIVQSYTDQETKVNALAGKADVAPAGLPAAMATAANQILADALQTATKAASPAAAVPNDVVNALDFAPNEPNEYTLIASGVAGGAGIAAIAYYSSVMTAASNYETVFDQSLLQSFGTYKSFITKAGQDLMVLPPSAAVAGVYASVDSNRGVWKAPANTSLASVSAPYVLLNAMDQESLNVDDNAGKSINAIRAFTGKGTLVWGSRTLAGNDNEWRYVPVRRYFNYAEESIKNATVPFVFEPNDINTWVRVKAMIENFLTLEWRRGALAGAKASDAFYVKVGLGETMTAQDILEGRMNVEIGLAVVRPAEFIILRFSHKMQES
ncbi:MAG TPA: phage tail sheath C-terminal domain-containing protein [Puia sp.]|nr:phage tail sheath C-terminal domain-containing protein [Puia sp.]